MVLGGYEPELLLRPEAGHKFTPVSLASGFFVVRVGEWWMDTLPAALLSVYFVRIFMFIFVFFLFTHRF